jgi:hypothetical protein
MARALTTWGKAAGAVEHRRQRGAAVRTDGLRAYKGVTLSAVRDVLDRYPIDQVTTLALGPLAEMHAPGHNGG